MCVCVCWDISPFHPHHSYFLVDQLIVIFKSCHLDIFWCHLWLQCVKKKKVINKTTKKINKLFPGNNLNFFFLSILIVFVKSSGSIWMVAVVSNLPGNEGCLQDKGVHMHYL